jgi:hypothetical protein
MDMISLGIDLGSLGAQPLVVNELVIQDPVVRVEGKEDGSFNLQVLLDNVEKNSDKADRKAAEQQPESETLPKGEPVRISFGMLAVSGVKVYASIPGQGPETVVLPDIVMRSVGGEEGLTPAQIGTAVIGKIAVRSLEEVLKKTMAEKIEEVSKDFLGDMKKRLMPEEDE